MTIRMIALSAILLMVLPFAQAQEPTRPLALSELAATADLVALVQVLDTDYQYTREFASGGTAFLKVLIPYRVMRPIGDIVEVYEEGLHEHECYFDNPSVIEEGRRHLVFLRVNPEVEGQYLGLAGGCALAVLVTDDNRYALRYPLDGIEVDDRITELATELSFADAHAVLDEEDIMVEERNVLLEAGNLRRLDDGRYKFTRGVDLSLARQLLGEENLTMDRALRRPGDTPGTD